MTNIAVIGPGAIGSTITAWLMQNASHSVFVAIRSKLSKIELQTPDRALIVSPQVVTHLRDAHPVD